MKPYEDFKKTVYDAIEYSNILPEEIIEQESTITISMYNDVETPEYLKNLSMILEAEELSYKSSVSIFSLIHTISISVFNC